MELEILKAKKEDFPYIQEKIEKYLLDGLDINWQQFFVAKLEDKVVSFGRIIDRGDSFEIATLAVDYYHRRKGIGKRMLMFLVQEAKRMNPQKPIYGVTHVGRFIASGGFVRISSNYPDYLDYKRKHMCHLDESKICVMKWIGDSS